MKIWIDADALPGQIKEIIIKAAHKRCIETNIVSIHLLYIPKSLYLSFVQVSQGPDLADAYIVGQVGVKGLVITQDIPLAAILVPKGIVVISFHGGPFYAIKYSRKAFYKKFYA